MHAPDTAVAAVAVGAAALFSGDFAAFLMFIFACCADVRKIRTAEGAAPYCMRNAERANNPSTWYRLDRGANTDDQNLHYDRDIDEIKTAIKAKNGEAIAAARQVAGHGQMAAAERALVDALYQESFKDETHRRQLLADSVAERTEARHLATVMGSLPVAQTRRRRRSLDCHA